MAGINKLKEYLMSKISSLIVKAIASGDFTIPDTKGKFQYVNLDTFKDVTKADVIRPQDYGFYSAPLDGSECLVLFPNGSQDEGIIIRASNTKYDPTSSQMESGDIMILHYKGHFIKLSDAGGVEIEVLNSKPITIKAKNVDIELDVGGKFTVAGDNLTVDA